MSRLNAIDEFTQTERAVFQRICRKLLKMTFIVKEKNEEHRKDFLFVKHNCEVFSEYFQIIGYDVICDSQSGTARLKNMASASEDGSIQSNRKRLKLWESVVLSALWLKYEEMLVHGGLTQSVIISKSELDFQIEKLGGKNKVDKTSMIAILKLFESFNLIEVIGQVGEPDCKIRLFTSMQFCLSDSEFKQLAENTAIRMKERKLSLDTDDDGYTSNEDGENNE